MRSPVAAGLMLMMLGGAMYGNAATDDRSFSDPANVPPPPPQAIGFPSRAPDLDVWPGFQAPPPGYGEVAFYWWMGDPLTRERLAWQLDQLAGRGVSGLQINYAHSDRGGRSYGLTFPSDPPLFSEAWWDLVKWFVGEAKRRGMAVSLSDYTLCAPGQGWYTDEVIRTHPELRGQTIAMEEHPLAGVAPASVSLPEGWVSATAFRTDGDRLVPGSGIDLRDRVRDRVLAWTPPAGGWRLCVGVARRHEEALNILHPQSGAQIIEHFFQRFEDRLPGEGGRGLNFFFSDELSFGVGGNLWSDTFADEFRRRKGYELGPEMAALFRDIGPRTPKVRLDYRDVMVALSEEHYFRPVFDWHQKRGMIYGCDHGGRGRQVDEFGDYFRTQRWNQGPGCDQPHLRCDLIKNKVASSIAHLYQRPRVWLEGYHSSGWGTSSAQVADATFANFMTGQNLLTFHGLYYSTHGGWWEWAPPDNHFRMPYWLHMESFMDCVQRLSYLLSQGDHRCDVAILYPVAPLEAGLDRGAVGAAFGTGEAVYRAGIDFDFMDFESLARAAIVEQELRVSGERYRVLVLPAMTAVRQSTLEQARAFHRAGGIVVAVGALPAAGDRVGRDDPELDAAVKEIFGVTAQEAEGMPAIPARRSAAGGLGLVVRDPAQAAREIDAAIPRDLRVAPAGGRLYFMHRRIGPRDVYALYGAPRGAEAFFRAQGRVELWDPWTGGRRVLPVVSQTPEGTTLRLPLDAAEVQLIVFGPGNARLAREADGTEPAPAILPLDGEWEVTLEPTLDNQWGDYRWPPTPSFIGPEARRFRYADEAAPDPGWQAPDFDDSKWPVVTHDFGPRFWKLGPLPDGAEVAALEKDLAARTRLDPAAAVDIAGRTFTWQAYACSWRWGVEDDPGHQGYHGLKEQVYDDFIALGRLQTTATSTRREREAGGSRYYIWSTVVAPSNTNAHVMVGGLKPAGAWLNGAPMDGAGAVVPLKAGANPLLLRYDQPGYGHVVFAVEPLPAPAAIPASGPMPMAARWHAESRILPFDLKPWDPRPVGWYRFEAPPGLRSMRVTARGGLEAWADGVPLKVQRLPETRPDGASVYHVQADAVLAGCARIALRLTQARGDYGGAAIPEPVAFDCGVGRMAPGDWSKREGLASYSGGVRYQRTIRLTPEQAGRATWLDLGRVVASAEVTVNGRKVGVCTAPPWRMDVSGSLKPGENRFEVLVLNTLANHYLTIPTRYRGSLESGLIGPVRLECSGPFTP